MKFDEFDRVYLHKKVTKKEGKETEYMMLELRLNRSIMVASETFSQRGMKKIQLI